MDLCINGNGEATKLPLGSWLDLTSCVSIAGVQLDFSLQDNKVASIDTPWTSSRDLSSLLLMVQSTVSNSTYCLHISLCYEILPVNPRSYRKIQQKRSLCSRQSFAMPASTGSSSAWDVAKLPAESFTRKGNLRLTDVTVKLT